MQLYEKKRFHGNPAERWNWRSVLIITGNSGNAGYQTLHQILVFPTETEFTNTKKIFVVLWLHWQSMELSEASPGGRGAFSLLKNTGGKTSNFNTFQLLILCLLYHAEDSIVRGR